MLLIATYDKFFAWVRWGGIITAVPLMISSMLFLFKMRDYNTLEIISSVGYQLLMLLQWVWAYNLYKNYKKENG